MRILFLLKRIAAIATALFGLSILLSGCVGRTGTTVVTVPELPPGKTFEANLTQNNLSGRRTVYVFAPNTNFSRVTIRTVTGVKNFGYLLRRSKTSVKRGVVLGTPTDMRDYLPTSGISTNYDCGSVTCQCEGEADCISLILSGKCGDEYWCSKATDYCYCDVKA
jgi:hypothetical protein